MYLRNVKQFIKNASPAFDEHRYGFHSFLDAVRSGQRAGLFRLERNRQGILRVFPGAQISQLQRAAGPSAGEPRTVVQPVIPYDVENDISLQQPEAEPAFAAVQETVVEPPPEAERPVPVEDLFRESTDWFPGILMLYDVSAGRIYRLETGQGDSEIW